MEPGAIGKRGDWKQIGMIILAVIFVLLIAIFLMSRPDPVAPVNDTYNNIMKGVKPSESETAPLPLTTQPVVPLPEGAA